MGWVVYPTARRRTLDESWLPGGYFGRALVVDLGDGGAEPLPAGRRRAARTIGGAGLGTHLRRRARRRPACDPLAPEAPLAFVFSPLVGTPLTTSAKFAVVAKSPLTERLNDALASSHFAIAGQAARATTRSSSAAPATQPSALVVDERRRARLEPAGDLWGLSAAEAEARAARAARPGLPRRRHRARRASGSSASPPSRTTAATPAAAGSAR